MEIASIASALFAAVAAIAAAVTAWAAYCALRQNKDAENIRLSQEKNAESIRLTLDFIRSYNAEPRVDVAREIMRSLENLGKEDIVRLCVDGDKRADLLFLLNEFEILAIGLERGIYDRGLVQKCFGRDIYECYSKCEVVIKEFHARGSPRAFSALEKLAADVMKQYAEQHPPR